MRVRSVAEALVHLTEHTHRDMGEIEVAPIEFELEAAANGVPAAQDGFEVRENIAAGPPVRILEKSEVGFFTSGAIIGRDSFVNQLHEIAIECLVEPS